MIRHIAVIDIGKTNAKLAVVRAEDLQEIAVVSRPNRVLPGPPWPHFDLEGHWGFFLQHLRAFHDSYQIDAIAITTHGASGVVLDAKGDLAAPMLDYEHPGIETWAADYDALRPDFSETGTPRLSLGLNLGAQLHYMLKAMPDLGARIAHVMTYPQYWAMRLTGVKACDVTSLGCHTDLWNPWQGRFSSLVGRLGLEGKFAPALRSDESLGPLSPEVVRVTGLSPNTPVTCGIHDSNASLYPHVLGRSAPFAVCSTGTWVVSMAVGGVAIALDPSRDTLVNVNALGQAVPSARFMGGREFEIIMGEKGANTHPNDADRDAVLAHNMMLIPAVCADSGPFPGQKLRWSNEPQSDATRLITLSYYLALMSHSSLELIGAKGPTIIEGPFAQNQDYLDMLVALRPDGVEITASRTGTSVGAALLALGQRPAPNSQKIAPNARTEKLRNYAASWQSLCARI